MSRDEKVYRDPETFNPDRFLDPEVPPVPIFGWGRRKCPGVYFGEASLFITVSSLLAAFTFSKKKDSNGDYVEPVIEDSPNSIILWVLHPLASKKQVFNKVWRQWIETIRVSNDSRIQRYLAASPSNDEQMAECERGLSILQATGTPSPHPAPTPFENIGRGASIRQSQRRVLFKLSYSAVGSSIFRATYGYTPQEKSDPFLKAAQETIDRGSEAVMVTNFFVNIIPALKFVPEWFPGAGWKRIIREWKKQKEYAQTAPYQWTQSQVSQGINKPSILSTLLQDHDLVSGLSPEEKEDRLKQLAFILYSAATDTTATLLVSFVAAMVLNPDIQLQAQQEIDLVLGSGVLPHISDRERLPYVNRLIMELLRWRPVAPIGRCVSRIQHKKGMGNLWAMSRDERYYQDPESFNPDRFLDPKVPPLSAFGWGRSICPRIHFGEALLFITIASLLATLIFSTKSESNGKYIEPVIEDAPNSLVLGLKPFEFEFAPRSEMHRRVIDEAI
ncbi:unnamed protein product [Rhizoctonia solani]|uniref:O-methylsterigmatocystin oxidoreductase n=1 Tax=Rhizoctonia solani TaxID=456999 RepID=A0A8H3API4_9AGAM|nr:unnamed protein product [Rhizoctonia solani]